MAEFVYMFRFAPESAPSPQEMPAQLQRWMAWMKDLEERGHIANNGHPLTNAGSVVLDDKGSFSDGPYAETKDVVMGFTVIRADDLAQARDLARGCPILARGGKVEIRPLARL